MGPGLRKQDRASIRYGDLKVILVQAGISGDRARPCALENPASVGMTIRLLNSPNKNPAGPAHHAAHYAESGCSPPH